MAARGPFLRLALLLGCQLFIWVPVLLGQRPYIASTFPRDGARNLACNTFIHLTVTFPSEGRQIDPVTLSESTVFLSPSEQPRKKITAALAFNQELGIITVTPREALKPETGYDLNISPGLVDERGFGFLPYKLRFYTGDCDQDLRDTTSTTLPPIAARRTRMPISLDLPEGTWRGDTAMLWGALPKDLPPSVLSVERSQESQQFVVQMQQPLDSALGQWTWQDTQTHWGWNRYRICLQALDGEMEICSPVQSLFRPHLALEEREYQMGDSLHFTAILPEKTGWVVIIYDPAGEIVKRKVGMIYPDQRDIRISLEELDPGPYMAFLRTKNRKLRQTIRVKF